MSSHCNLCGHVRPAVSKETPPEACKRAHASLCSLCRQITENDRELVEAKTTLERVLEKQQTLKAQFNSHHDAFICRLPLELAARIFEYCMPAIPTIRDGGYGPLWSGRNAGPRDRTRRPQLKLGAVCRQWRWIIWSNPQFWNVIQLWITPNSPLYSGTILQEWIDRSGELPLCIFIHYSDTTFFEKPHSHPTGLSSLLASIVVTLDACVHRWATVNLTLPSSYMTMLRGWTAKSSILKGLILDIIADDSSAQPLVCRFDGKFDIFPVAQPEHLGLSSFLWKNFVIDLCNLISFHGSHMLIQDCLEVMRLAPRMASCTFQSVDANDTLGSTPFPSGPLLHTSLERLRVAHSAHEILDHLTCPQVWDLAVFRTGDITITDELEEFVKRSNCSLQSFNIMMDSQSDNDLIEFLKLTPALRYLEVSGVGDKVFKHIGNTSYTPEGSEGFLPLLDTFTFEGTRDFLWSSVPCLIPATQQQKANLRPLHDITLKLFDEGEVPPAICTSGARRTGHYR